MALQQNEYTHQDFIKQFFHQNLFFAAMRPGVRFIDDEL